MTFAQAYASEKRRGRLALVVWILLAFGVTPQFTSAGWLMIWGGFLFWALLAGFTHYSRDAVRYRAYRRSER